MDPDELDDMTEALAAIFKQVGGDVDRDVIRKALGELADSVDPEVPENFAEIMDACERNPLLAHSLMTCYPHPSSLTN